MPKKKQGDSRDWFLRPLVKKQYKRERKAAEKEQFGPLDRQLGREQVASQRQQQNIGNYFNDYQNKLAQLRGETGNLYATAQQQLGDRQTQAAGLDKSRMDEIQGAAQADAAKRGVSVDPSVAQRAASAQSARTNLGSSFGGLLASQGANAGTYLADKERIGAGEGISQKIKEFGRERNILSDMRESADKKRLFRDKFRQQARESERQFYLSNKTIGGENFRAKLSAQGAMSRAQLQAQVSRANAQLQAATSSGNTAAIQAAENARAAKERRLKKFLNAHPKKKK